MNSKYILVNCRDISQTLYNHGQYCMLLLKDIVQYFEFENVNNQLYFK